MCFGSDREVQGFEPTVSPDVAKVQHRDVVVFDVSDDVGLRQLLRWLSEGLHKRVWAEGNGVG